MGDMVAVSHKASKATAKTLEIDPSWVKVQSARFLLARRCRSACRRARVWPI